MARWIHPLALAAALGAGLAPAAEVFRDVTDEAGIRFALVTGASGKKHLPETMVGGAAWLDADGDGRLDLYIVQAHSDPDRAREPGPEGDVLLRNRGDGTFEDITARAGVGDRGYGGGAAVGDIDNDGDADLYVTNYGRNTLYRNRGDGSFEDITEEAGVACPLWSASAAFCDLDGDGLLDLFVANYVDFDPAVHPPCHSGSVRAYCHPSKFRGLPDSLYRGLGGGRFEDRSVRSGVAVGGRFKGNGLGVLPTDIDRDGDLDLFVACDSVPNQLWMNLGGLRFEDAAHELGVALSPEGKALAGMGIDGGDVNGDGLLDYYITNFSREPDSLFLGHASGFPLEGGAIAGIAAPTWLPLAFGTKLFDYDLDGDLDIYTACGHVTDTIQATDPGSGETWAQPDLLLENDGRGRFRDVSRSSGAWFSRALVGRGAAFGDYDDDGDTDIFIVNAAGPGVLLRNERPAGNHWVGFRLEGDGKRVNRDGYGAMVTVVSAAGARRVFEARAAGSYLASHDPRVVCGLGAEAALSGVEVEWPDGTAESFPPPAVDRYHRLVQGTGKKLEGRRARELKR